jgi:hypothetical protein
MVTIPSALITNNSYIFLTVYLFVSYGYHCNGDCFLKQHCDGEVFVFFDVSTEILNTVLFRQA